MKRGLAGTFGLWALVAIGLRAVVIPGESCPVISADAALAAASNSENWIERAQRPDGSYIYEYDRETQAEAPEYNSVRHAGVTMSLYQLAAGGEAKGLPTADRALAWEIAHLLHHGDWVALKDSYDGSVELGASALMLDGLLQRRFATNDASHDDVIHGLARFLLTLQRPDGSFLGVYDEDAGAPNPHELSRYGTGEAFWALTLLHRAFPDEGWEKPARLTADYLSLHRDEAEHLKFPPWADQWAAYGLAEMASWPLSDANIAYARALAERFGFLIRVESQRRDSTVSKLLHGRQARAAGMGTWVEGLDSIYRIASSDARLADVRGKVAERAVCGAGMLTTRQTTPKAAAARPRPGLNEGAWFTEGKTRMDDQQHALSALLNGAPILAKQAKATR